MNTLRARVREGYVHLDTLFHSSQGLVSVGADKSSWSQYIDSTGLLPSADLWRW